MRKSKLDALIAEVETRIFLDKEDLGNLEKQIDELREQVANKRKNVDYWEDFLEGLKEAKIEGKA